MSTLKADTIQNTSGGAATLTDQAAAKHFIAFNGADTTPTATESLNGSSITDNGTGDFSVAITNNMSIANYSKQVSHDDVLYGGMSYFHGDGSTAGSYRIMARVGHTTNPATYNNDMYAMTIGDLA